MDRQTDGRTDGIILAKTALCTKVYRSPKTEYCLEKVDVAGIEDITRYAEVLR